MPNARQLLEQADALMRRNRKRGKGKGTGPPTLTDALTNERTGTLAPTIILPEAKSAADSIALGAQSMADPISLDTLSDLPVLTDVVDEWSSQAEVWPPVVPDADATALTEALDDALRDCVRTHVGRGGHDRVSGRRGNRTTIGGGTCHLRDDSPGGRSGHGRCAVARSGRTCDA